MSSSVPVLTSTVWAKAARNVALHLRNARLTFCVVGSESRGGRLSADGAQYLLAKHLATARQNCPSLREKRVTLHVLRHTTAMALLQGGVDTSSIALWLGHESPATTHVYLDANLAFKEKILGKMETWNG